jgi:RHS repeat-associated protein
MNFRVVVALTLFTLFLSPTIRAEEASTAMAPQPDLSLTQGASGTWKTDWEGVTGRTYLMEWSNDLVNWNYFPLTEAGAGSKAYEFASSPDKMFVRLNYSDEIPDLGKTTDWQPPLLLVAGEWTVLAKDKNGDPAVGVELAFFRWPANAPKPQSTPVSNALTSLDGKFIFDPASLDTEDRVEVRMTGSPNQRVYLPWSAGRETPDLNIAQGGNGLEHSKIDGILVGGGTGKIPDPSSISPNKDNSPVLESMPVFRLEDYLTMGIWQEFWGDTIIIEEFPSNFHTVTERTTVFGQATEKFVDTPTDASNWNNAFLLGNIPVVKTTPENVYGEPYEAKFGVVIGNPDQRIQAQRNIFTNTDPYGIEDVWPVPNPVYPPLGIEFRDGIANQHDWGVGNFPYHPDETPFVQNQFGRATRGLSYSRQVILGPVPAWVPLSVLAGEKFYFGNLAYTLDPEAEDGEDEFQRVSLSAELPLGSCAMPSYFSDPPPSQNTDRVVPTQIVWTAEVAGDLSVEVSIDKGDFGQTSVKVLDESYINMKFQDRWGTNDTITSDFSVTVTAKLRVFNQEFPPSTAGGDYTYGFTDHNLGSFTTEFEYIPDELEFTANKRQISQLSGVAGGALESSGFNGGQRFKTLEPERKIGITGQPAPDSLTFVDALTGRFHHSETDFSLAIPGSDLSLAVTRSVKDTIWTGAFGLQPEEDPLAVFGPGWESNLGSSLHKTNALMPDGSTQTPDPLQPRGLKSRISVRDYQGRGYSFLENTNGQGITTFLADPTMMPERSNSGISLSASSPQTFSMTQPLLGITHSYQKTTVDFKMANSRDIATIGSNNATGFTRYEYFRLTSVTDRFGVTLNYNYGSNPLNLVPDSVSVAGRPALKLQFQQSAGKIQAFWDPAGVKHTYHYESRNLAALGQPSATHQVLASQKVGTLTETSYGYQYLIEADPRPSSMLLTTTAGNPYTIPTYHIKPNSIRIGDENPLVIHQRVSNTRWAWSKSAAAYFNPAGDPLVVDSITLPNQLTVDFDLQHVLKNGRSAIPAQGNVPAIAAIPSNLSIVTLVTTMSGDHWRYDFGTATPLHWQTSTSDAWHLPTASALFFPKLTRSCLEVPNSEVEFHYDAAAGCALAKTKDAANRESSATYDELFGQPNPLYQAPLVAPGKTINSRLKLPSTRTDPLNRTTTYHYTPNNGDVDSLLVSSVVDFRNRIITPSRGVNARTESVKIEAGGNILTKIDLGYDTALPGAVNQITRKAIPGAGDPAWVTDLVKDIQLDTYGFPARVGNDAANLHTKVTRSPAGRVLTVETPNGGVHSNIYNSAGLLESESLADGSQRTYQQDRAGRMVLARDALGQATATVFDPLGRVTSAIRDMNGNLSYDPATGLSGVDAGTDIVSSAQFLDAFHEVQLTDPRGYIKVRKFDALSRTTEIITPANERLPGIIPTVSNDYVTSFGYDLLESPSSPVSITDPLGYETLHKFDSFARLKKVLRGYGTEGATTLYSGTVYGYDPATGLADSMTAIRTPLDAEGQVVGSEPLKQLTSKITYDLLDRPNTSIFAEGTPKEIRSRSFHTSTGIRYKSETRDQVTQGSTPERWSSSELTCDALGRPLKQSLSAVVDALTGNLGIPFHEIFYNSYGQVQSLADPYGNKTQFGYDVMGSLAYKKAPAVEDAKSGKTQEPVTIYQYDPVRRLERTVDPLGYAWSYQHDAAHRVKKATGPIVNPASVASRRRPVWVNFFDAAGNLTQTIDPEGHGVSRAYYPNNLLASITTPVTFTDDTGASSLLNVVEQYQRDAVGNITRVIDGKNQATAFTYDGLRRPLSTTRDPDDSRSKTETTEYDALLALATVDAKNQRKEFGYDEQFLLTQLDVINNPAESLSYVRDLLGRVSNIDPTTPITDTSMGNPSIAQTRDILGRLASETSNGITTTYGYDLLHRVAKVSNSANTRLLSIQHDPAGRTNRIVDLINGANLTTAFGHDLAGNQVLESMSNGFTKESDFDPIRRITSQRIRDSANQDTISRNDYQYDLTSNVTRIEESTAALNVPDRIVENTYNERRQLLTETQTQRGGSLGTSIHGRSEIHRYDTAENRISTQAETLVDGVVSSTLTRAFDFGDASDGLNSNQLRQLTEVANNGPPVLSNYTFDNNGNRSAKTLGSASDIYTYDSFDRLSQLSLNTATPSENGNYHYRYDPLTRRISRSVGVSPTSNNTHQFAFSDSTPVHEWDGALNNGSRVDNLGGGVGGKLYTQDGTGSIRYPFHNARGDIMAEFTSGGTMTWYGTHASSGLLQSQVGTRSSPYGANGKWEEPGGLINDGFRYRDRNTNTFITPDPAGFIDGPNTYNYVGHNPWSAWDPNGLATSLIVPAGTADIGYTGPPNSNTTYTQLFDNSGSSWGAALGILSLTDQDTMTENTRSFTAGGSLAGLDYGFQKQYDLYRNISAMIYGVQQDQEQRRLEAAATVDWDAVTGLGVDAAADVAGFIDPSGAVDSANAARLYSEGRYVEGTLVGIGVIPVVGDLVGKGLKYAGKSVKTTSFWVLDVLTDLGKYRGAAKTPLGLPAPRPTFGTSLSDVSKSVFKDGSLPDNFITKDVAEALGWQRKLGNLDTVAPGKSIGGDIFRNEKGLLPNAPGRIWNEADLNYSSGYRGSERLLYSNDGQIFYSGDHYKTFQQLGGR